MFSIDQNAQQFVNSCISQSKFPLLPITSKKTIDNCKSLKKDNLARCFVYALFCTLSRHQLSPTRIRTGVPIRNQVQRKLFFVTHTRISLTHSLKYSIKQRWMQNIVYTLVTKGERDLDHISYYAPFYEADRTWNEDGEIEEPANSKQKDIEYRIFNTHLLPSMIPREEAKYIYVVRNPKDVVCSFFHHLKAQHPDDGGFEGPFEEFYEKWIRGDIAFGKWTSHIKQWLEFCGSSLKQVLVVSFEAMKANLSQEMCRISKYLELDLSDEIIEERCVPKCTFKYMKEHDHCFSPKTVRFKKDFKFIRKGQVGNGKAMLSKKNSETHNEMLNRSNVTTLMKRFRSLDATISAM
jgi:sulfotransferase